LINTFFTFFIISAIIFQTPDHTSFVLWVRLIIFAPEGRPDFNKTFTKVRPAAWRRNYKLHIWSYSWPFYRKRAGSRII